jgi:hypothetical protein
MWINEFNNGMVHRVVFFNGKRWHVFRVTEGPNKGKQFSAVFPSAHSRFPRAVRRHRRACPG